MGSIPLTSKADKVKVSPTSFKDQSKHQFTLPRLNCLHYVHKYRGLWVGYTIDAMTNKAMTSGRTKKEAFADLTLPLQCQ